MRNPRPCECGHLEGPHLTLYGHPGHCRPCLGRLTECFAYRPARRKEPLRAPDTRISHRWLSRVIDAERTEASERYHRSPVRESPYWAGQLDVLAKLRKRCGIEAS